jgi:adenylate kinase
MSTSHNQRKSRHGKQTTKSPLLLLLLVLTNSLRNYVVDGLHDQTPRLWGSKKNIPTQRELPIAQNCKIEVPFLDTKSIAVEPMPTAFLSERGQMPRLSNAAIQRERSHHPPRIIIIGGPASGKGTQCEKIAEKYGVIHLSTGDMLREAVKDGTNVGRIAKGYMDRGELVPDEVIIAIVQSRLKQRDCVEQGWLLDGFPRTKAQAEHLKTMGIHADVTLLLNVADDELVERVVGRRRDPVTGKIYHLKFNPPPPDVVGSLEQRSDDTRESFRVRLKQYHTNLSQIKSYLEESVVMVDGRGSPDLVSRRVSKSIDRVMRQSPLPVYY